MNKKIPLGLALALLLIVSCLSISLTMVFAMDRFSSTVNEVAKRQAMFDYITEIDKSVRQNHTGTINESKLREALASAYMQNVGDKYADYLTADEYAAAQKTRKGTADGFGISLTRGSEGEALVSSLDLGSPAHAAGIQAGDVITAINDMTLGELSGYSLAREELEAVSKAVLTVKRGDKTMSFSLVRNEYTSISVTGRMIGTIGYVRIRSFTEATPAQFYEEYDALISKGATAVIFDLRGNNGGSLEAATAVLDHLMPRGTYANLTDSSGEVTAFSAGGATYELTLPSVTLVNALTAGEAELFAGVLQEFSLSTIVGVTTYGRACVQEYFSISSDNAAILLTTGELSLPRGGSWEGVGIRPDTEAKLEGTIVHLDMLTDEQDSQLSAALAVLTPPAEPEPSQTTATTTTTAKVTTTTTTATDVEEEE